MEKSVIEVILLGSAQDGGFPQFGCRCDNCRKVYNGELKPDTAVSLAVIDNITKKWWLFDPSPQLAQQWAEFASVLYDLEFAGAFITHAHAGHYPGILYFGKEALNCSKVPLYCSASLHGFLSANEPWKTLYIAQNIVPVTLEPGVPVRLSDQLEVSPIRIEHRADFTDTLCFGIKGPQREMLFCPDIDSWNQCAHVSPPPPDRSSSSANSSMNTPAPALPPPADTSRTYALPSSDASGCDVARNWLQEVLFLGRFQLLLLDATFYSGAELPGRDMTRIPHPRVCDTVRVVQHFSNSVGSAVIEGSQDLCHVCPRPSEAATVVLIHLNHSNPLWVDPELVARLRRESGIITGAQGMTWGL